MAKNKTIFQRLTNVVIGVGNNGNNAGKVIRNYTIPETNNNVLYTFDNKEERDRKLTQLKQQKLLAYQWAKSGYETSMEQLAGASQVKIMYRDADLMDNWPEIGAALDIVSEEATCLGSDKKMLNIYSNSDRIRSVLEDLFVNRLDIHTTLPMITRATCKYGNEFMFLNIDANNGVMGWRELPVHEMRRVENGMENMYSASFTFNQTTTKNPDEVKYVWEGHNEAMPYKNWQVAHFRLIKDSLFLPYGVSWLNKARRHWRMLSMMEDAMLLYRLERSIERRIFKVNVGMIDDADVPAFLQEFMNNVKRAPIIDPQTGQIDLRKNFLDVSADYVIPVRSGQDPTSIDNLQSAQNQTAMDDIEYMQNKVLSALRVPKSFLNFQEAQGKGQNLSLLDIRFNRTINSVQQAIIMELTKIAIIHLYVLGFADDLTNFSLTMNNPSNQIEMMMLDNLTKKINAATAALAEQGGGIPIMSWHQVQKEIMGKTDSEISDILNEIRLEMALAMEIQQTNQIIKKTGLFNKVDRIYGEPGAQYTEQQGGGGDDGGLGGGGGGAPLGGGFGDDLGDMGEPGSEDMGDLGGEEGSADLSSMGDGIDGGGTKMENIHKVGNRNIITESAINNMRYFNEYISRIDESKKKENNKQISIIDKSFLINENIDSTVKGLENEISHKVSLLD